MYTIIHNHVHDLMMYTIHNHHDHVYHNHASCTFIILFHGTFIPTTPVDLTMDKNDAILVVNSFRKRQKYGMKCIFIS